MVINDLFYFICAIIANTGICYILLLYLYNMISLITNPSNPTYGVNIMYVKGIKPLMVRFARLDITIKPKVLGIVYISPK